MNLAKDSWKLQPPRGYKEWGRGEVCLERLRARPKETYRQHWTESKKVGAGVGAHLVDSGQDMTLQAFACFFNLFTWNDGMRL